jgi:hypothetical protein
MEFSMRQTRVRQFDAFTGEEIDGSLVYIPPRKKNGFSEGWVAMEQKTFFELVAEGSLTLCASRVWAGLMANVDYGNIIRKSQRQIANEIGMAPQNFNRGVKELCEHDIFFRVKTDGRTELRLNPEHGWKGTGRDHIKALAELRKTRERPVAKTT